MYLSALGFHSLAPPINVHAAVTDIDARVVVGEQWIIDPAYVRDTGESLGSGSNGTVKKGLLYDHVPVALKVRCCGCEGLLSATRTGSAPHSEMCGIERALGPGVCLPAGISHLREPRHVSGAPWVCGAHSHHSEGVA